MRKGSIAVPAPLPCSTPSTWCTVSASSRHNKGPGERLWPWLRMIGWRAVHAIMVPVGSTCRSPGLGHGFGVAAASAGLLDADPRVRPHAAPHSMTMRAAMPHAVLIWPRPCAPAAIQRSIGPQRVRLSIF
jgi:hypothetical protein